MRIRTLGAFALIALAGFNVPASAEPICGWYVIVFCSDDRGPADNFAGNGWGAVIDTNDYDGFASGKFCVVSGPQSKSSARRDRRNAKRQGVARDAYMKRACTDETGIGD